LFSTLTYTPAKAEGTARVLTAATLRNDLIILNTYYSFESSIKQIDIST